VKVVRKLGKGGLGNVYETVDPDTNYEYAIKRMDHENAKDGVKAELDVLFNKNLQTKHLVRYFAEFSDGPFTYIIMENCKGGNLQEYIEKHKNPDEIVIFIIFFFF
jgi:serine/threonine protein kinase